MSDSDDSWETDEEENVVIKLAGVVVDDIKKKLCPEAQMDITVMELEEEQPILQIGNELFRGAFSHPIGTDLILTEITPGQDLEFLCASEKQIEMKKLYYKKKDCSEVTTAGADDCNVEQPLGSTLTSSSVQPKISDDDSGFKAPSAPPSMDPSSSTISAVDPSLAPSGTVSETEPMEIGS